MENTGGGKAHIYPVRRCYGYPRVRLIQCILNVLTQPQKLNHINWARGGGAVFTEEPVKRLLQQGPGDCYVASVALWPHGEGRSL